MVNRQNITILSLVSGKGGVGKTTLSLALASELSAAGNNVVIIDYDFSNRGLSELVADHGRPTGQVLVPEEPFTSPHKKTDDSWPVLDLGHGIQTVKIPPLEPDTLQFLESCPLKDVQGYIDDLTRKVLDITGADIVVLDCHGSRDNVSYAAAAISDHVFVVTVPEIITFFGTIRFIEGFKSATESAPNGPKLHLLFNSVMEGFRRSLLSHWYKEYFKKYFDDDNFLSLIPFDSKISIATSEELFPTRKLYYSAMAEKVRILVHSVFGDQAHIKVSREAWFVTTFLRLFIRSRKPILSAVVNEKIPIRLLIASLSITFLGAFVLFKSQEILRWEMDPQVTISAIFMLNSWIPVAFIWIAVAFLARSIIDQDMMASGEFRYRSWQGIGKPIYRMICVLLGIAVFLMLDAHRSPFDMQIDPYIAASRFLLALAGVSDESFVEIFSQSFFFAIQAAQTIIVITFGAFAIVFLIRSIRTLLFRMWSGESLYRIAVLVGLFLFFRAF